MPVTGLWVMFCLNLCHISFVLSHCLWGTSFSAQGLLDSAMETYGAITRRTLDLHQGLFKGEYCDSLGIGKGESKEFGHYIR
ncbi:hypothetical protein V8C26DRAFT_389078 [Trichoderma gracile]